MSKEKRKWELTVHSTHLSVVDAPGAPPFVLLRKELMKSFTFIEGLRVLDVKKPVKVTFKLPAEAAAALSDWVGKPWLAALYLKRRYSWVLPAAIIWILGSLPLPADAEGRFEAVRFDPLGIALGGSLVVAWAFAKWRPHPVLFLVDSIWFGWLGVYLVAGVLHGRSKGWLVLVALLLWSMISGVRHFLRFRGTVIEQMAS